MIRKNLLHCKLILNISSINLYADSSKMYSPLSETCPSCGAKGYCRVHGHYHRFITDYIDGKVVDSEITLVRVKCSVCGHTHSIIPAGFVPYDLYSLSFMLQVLLKCFSRSMTIDSICQCYQISVSTLYRWIHLFKIHKFEWLGILKSAKTSSLSFLQELLDIYPFSDFSCSFLDQTLYSFMQSHKNPANSRQRPPGFKFT